MKPSPREPKKVSTPFIPDASLPKVALLGRPNVGKSTLFNRLIRSNRAITHDRPGVTRDRMEGIVKRHGHDSFTIIDTGGVTLDQHSHVQDGPEELRGFEAAILEQAREAVSESALLCLVVDGRDGLTPFDRHLADFLRRMDMPLMLIVNKVDGPEKEDLLAAEFYSLGLDMVPCSAAHGYNVRFLEEEIRERLFGDEDIAERNLSKEDTDILFEDLPAEEQEAIFEADLTEAESEQQNTSLDEIEDILDEEELILAVETEEEIDTEIETDSIIAPKIEDVLSGPLRIAVLGRPNAGKSSLVNAMAGEKRMIVSDIAGTTRDSVDVGILLDGEPCVFVDTAGVRRRAKVIDSVERYSVNSSLKSTTKAHVTLLLLDGAEGLTQQDKRLIDLLDERKTPFMVLVNKVDLMEAKLRKEAEKKYKEALVFCPHVPLLFISALKKRNLQKIVPTAKEVRRECGVRIGTGQLNRAMNAVLERHQPPIVKRARPKFFYLTQAESMPPTFVFFVSDSERILPSYARYLERALRKLFGIVHAPMRIHFRSSHNKRKDRK